MQVVVDLGEEALEGGEPAAEGAGGEVEVELGAGEGAGFGFENVAGEVLLGGDLEGDADAFLGNGAAGFDFVAFV